MKTQMGLFLDVGTAERLRSEAGRAGAPIGDLADLCIRFALERMTPDAVAKWAQSLPSRMGPLSGGPKKNERAVIAAFERLPRKAGQEGAWKFPLTDVAAEAGLRLTDAFWALKALQARKLVHGSELEEVDRWGRPVKSFWSLISAMPEQARPKGLNS